jgi:membrane associated rhomboid family serine protease
MLSYDGNRWRVQWPRSVALALIVVNAVAYFLELVLLRAGSDLPDQLMLTPAEVVGQGKVWQLFTTMLLHDPNQVAHLLYNMLWLWMVAPALEALWGPRRLLTTYVLAGLAGALFTVLVGALGLVFPPFASVWASPHLGASGAVLGLVTAWCIVNWEVPLNMLFLGNIRGRTFFLIVVVIEILTALSFSGVSSTSHFGGMIGGAVLGLELWRPAHLRAAARRQALLWKKRQLERKLARFEVIEGGRGEERKSKRGRDANDWVN